MKKRQIFVLLLSLILVIAFSSFAFADGDGYYVVKLDKTNGIVLDEYGSARVNFTLPAKGKVTVNISFTDSDLHDKTNLEIWEYDGLDCTVWFGRTDKYNTSKKAYVSSDSATLAKGKYFLLIEAGEDNAGGTLKCTVNYRPSLGSTSITKLTAKKKGFTVKYKKAANATGYQIRYSRSSKMTNAGYKKTTALYKTVTKLKAKKRYYVQVRAYRTLKVDGKTKTYYSAWSARKYVKTK